MNNKFRSKSLVSIILLIITLSTPLQASPSALNEPVPPTAAEHQKIITQFISEIRAIQNQVFDIAQFALSGQLSPLQTITPNIQVIDNNIERLNRRIQDYLQTIPRLGIQNRDVLLISNALNLIKNGLYTLNLLTSATTDIQRVTLLDEFFRSRIAAKDTLNTVEELLTQN